MSSPSISSTYSISKLNRASGPSNLYVLSVLKITQITLSFLATVVRAKLTSISCCMGQSTSLRPSPASSSLPSGFLSKLVPSNKCSNCAIDLRCRINSP